MSKRPTKPTEPDIAERAADYCRTGEQAAHYIMGVADAIESLNKDGAAKMIYRLRHHAEELNSGTLYVEHGYEDAKPKGGSL